MRVSWEYIYTPVYISPSICISVLPPGLADRLSCRHRIVWRSDLIKKISGCYRISVLRPSSDRNRHYYRDLHFFVCISFIVSASKLQAIRFDSIKTGVYMDIGILGPYRIGIGFYFDLQHYRVCTVKVTCSSGVL